LLSSSCLLLGITSGCGRKRAAKIKEKVITEKTETTETAEETEELDIDESTPEGKAAVDLNEAQKQVDQAVSEVESEIKEIEKINSSEDNESGI
jgi:hypothetical protein